MKEIKLTQNQVALVDDADYDWLNQWKWYAKKALNGDFYARRNSPKVDGIQHTILMHRQILGLEKGDKRQVDHRDHNTLDNRQDNIRICTCSQNQMNMKSHQDSTSNFKGVGWHKQLKKWEAQIQVDDKKKSLGYYNNEIDAVLAYNEAAKKYFGNFAFLNKIT